MIDNTDLKIRKQRSDCTLIVSSCDAYLDLWKPFFTLFFRYWPDCPFKILLISETVVADIPGVISLPAGNFDWSSRLLIGVRKANTPYILLMLDDFFLRAPVSTADVLELYDYMKSSQLNMLRLIPRPGPDSKCPDNQKLGRIDPGAEYKVSSQGAFWRSSILKRVAKEGESIWMFESNGSKRSKSLDKFVSVCAPVLTYKHHVVERGKWFPWYGWYFKRMQIGVKLTARPVMSLGETIRWIMQKALGPFATKLTKGRRQALKPILQRLKII